MDPMAHVMTDNFLVHLHVLKPPHRKNGICLYVTWVTVGVLVHSPTRRQSFCAEKLANAKKSAHERDFRYTVDMNVDMNGV